MQLEHSSDGSIDDDSAGLHIRDDEEHEHPHKQAETSSKTAVAVNVAAPAGVLVNLLF
jgi:hypothetical protein